MNAPGDTHMHGPVGVFNNGDAPITIQMPCPGPHACPHDRGEEALQRKFEENTGISCGKGPRIALQHLLDVGHFDRRQLALAWRMKSIVWDWDDLRVRANESRLESAYGYSLIALGLTIFIVYIAVIILDMPSQVSWQLVLAILTTLMMLAMALLSEKYLVRPNRIAKLARPVIEAYYKK